MKLRLVLLLIFLPFFLNGAFTASAGNLSLIEKRLIELDKLNKQAVEQIDELPKDGTVEIEAKVGPGVNEDFTSKGKDGKRIDFTKKKILALDEKVPFTVQISASKSQQQCYRVAAMLRRTGYPAFTGSLKIKDQGIWHRIFVGSFATKEEAEKIRQTLEDDEISDSLVKNMPYAIQIGKSGSLESFKELRDKLVNMHYLPYTSYARDVASDTIQTRLLLGAFETKEDTATLLDMLREKGLDARVVTR